MQRALRSLEQIAVEDRHTGHYNVVINACAEEGRVGDAEHWLELMATSSSLWLRPNIASYSGVINACVKAGDTERAVHWLQQMESAGGFRRHRKNSALAAASFASVINAFANQNDAQQAEHLLWQMCEAGLWPNEKIYNSVINAWAINGEAWKADDLLLRMWRDAWLTPNEESYNIVINALAKTAHVNPQAMQRAEDCVEEMRGAGFSPDTRSSNSMINAYEQ